MSDWNDNVIAEFRQSNGTTNYWGPKLVVLHTIGAKSGEERLSPVVGFERNGGWQVVASKGGAPENPAWYHNMLTHPEFDIEALVEEGPDWLDGAGRARVEGARHSLAWRIDTLAAWEALLDRLGGPADPDFVDWLAVERSDAREFDVGLHRRFLDPMKPFAKVVLEPAHGVMLTSATLKDGSDWDSAVARSGALYRSTFHPRS